MQEHPPRLRRKEDKESQNGKIECKRRGKGRTIKEREEIKEKKERERKRG